MGWKFNSGNGCYLCDNCRKVMFDYMHNLYIDVFLAKTKQSKNFKGIEVWSKGNKRFCTAKCMKRYNDEDDTIADIIYSD